MCVQPHRPGEPPKQVTPEEFFGRICQRVMEQHEGVCARLGGTYGFHLCGEGGGAWTLDFASRTVDRGLRERVDLYMEMGAEDFSHFIRGSLDVGEAADVGRIRMSGDLTRLVHLSSVLTPRAAVRS